MATANRDFRARSNRASAGPTERGWLAGLLVAGLGVVALCANLIGAESSFDKPVAKGATESDQTWWSLEPMKNV